MKKQTCLLMGLGLGLVLILFGALAGTSTPANALALHTQHGSLGLYGAVPTEHRSAHALTNTGGPVWRDTPLRLGSVVTLLPGQEAIEADIDDTVRVIIQLKGSPVSVYKRHLRASPARVPPPEEDRVRAYDTTLREQHQLLLRQLQTQGITLKLRREYTYVFNGLAASIRTADLERIAAMPGVSAVHPDDEVHALLEDSVPLIGADQVWTMVDPYGQSVTGQGIRVAVLDTGIDYTHPDLGGCFGPGCKVVGGYDFVNDDGDPMDDDWHGTHCAGIVAANGTVKGVAPDAGLYAYKVLDEEGYGWDSDIIAGIERAVDPDGDPGTDDTVDVISMSLGGAGNPNDPVALAVDVAADQGVVVVVAAGNSGPAYQTVESPGVARKAFTVGASDKSDNIADFSSRGPVPGFYELIKPDIVAPGVAIRSAYPGEGHQLKSGTSMAAPHIAGCAALIKQLHPSWSPQMIQANLMNTSKDLGENVFTQGAGRVQVDDAAGAVAVMAPGNVGLGLVDTIQPLWTKSAALLLLNVSTTTLEFSLSVSGTLPAGVATHVDPGVVALGPGQSVTVTMVVTVDNSITPYQDQEPGSYEGRVVAQPGAELQAQGQSRPDSLVVPFALHKPAAGAPEQLWPPDDWLTEDHQMSFSWEAVPGTAQYRIQIDTSSSFDSTDLINETVASSAFTATLGHGFWYWHVVAVDSHGIDISHSDVWRFNVADPPVQVTTDTGNDVDPAVTRSADGTIWVVWASDRLGNSELWYKNSSDDGATWSSAARLTADPGDDQGGAIIQSSDGTLWVVWASDRSGDYDIWSKTSSDGGATWSADIPLSIEPGDDLTPAITQAADGTLWLVWSSDRSGSWDVWCKSSSDNGQTWSVERQLTTGTGSEHYPAITQASEGTLWITWASGSGVWCSTSGDGGVTWSAERSLVDDAPYGEPRWPSIVEGGDSALWLMWSKLWVGLGEKVRTGSDVLYKSSNDNGATWSWARSWTRFMGYNDAPDLAALGDGAVAVVWGSNRWANDDVWFGVLGRNGDVNPPPYLDDVRHDPAPDPYGDETVTVGAQVDDEAGLSNVSLIWTRNGAPQSSLDMHDDGTHGDRIPGDRWWHGQFGPFPAGTRITYQVQAVDDDGNTVSAPTTPISFTVASRAPEVGAVTPPGSGGPAGITVTLATVWLDPDGWEDLKHCYFHIGDSPSLLGNITLLYNAKKNRLWIRSDDGSTWLGGYAPGSANVLENSQARVDCSVTAVHAAGDTIRVEWAICFKPTFTGTKKLGSKCKDIHLVRAKGEWIGTWTTWPDTTITMQQGSDGYTGSEDTYIHQYAPDSNYCSHDTFKVGSNQQYAALLHFDLSPVPASASIAQAALEARAVGWGGSNMTIDAFRILRSSNLCQATWNQAEDGNNWGAPGCDDTVTDRGAAPESSVTAYDNHVWYSFDLTSLVQDWMGGSLANSGLLLRGASPLSSSMFYFASAQHDNMSLRPKLVITYPVPAEVDQSQTGMNYGYAFEVDTDRWQEFMPMLDNLSAVEVHVVRWGDPGNVIVEIQTLDGAILASRIVDQSDVQSGWLRVSFSPRTNLVPGTKYRIHVDSDQDSPSPTDRYFWSGNTNSEYNPECENDQSHLKPGYGYAFKTLGFRLPAPSPAPTDTVARKRTTLHPSTPP